MKAPIIEPFTHPAQTPPSEADHLHEPWVLDGELFFDTHATLLAKYAGLDSIMFHLIDDHDYPHTILKTLASDEALVYIHINEHEEFGRNTHVHMLTRSSSR